MKPLASAIVPLFCAFLACQPQDTDPAASHASTQAEMQSLAPSLVGISLSDLTHRVSPAVVTIWVNRKAALGNSPLSSDVFGEEPWDLPEDSWGCGSGFIVDSKQGLIITNEHVVTDSGNIEVNLGNEFFISARVVLVDAALDIAVLQITPVPGHNSEISLGDSDAVRPADWVLAIGSPYNLSNSVSLGIISGKGRTLSISRDPDKNALMALTSTNLLQTDALILPGNSGGPLLNLRGEAIGVNVAAGSGMGLAIPINSVKPLIAAVLNR